MRVHVYDARDRYQYLSERKFFTLYKVMVINMSLPVAHDTSEIYANRILLFSY